MKQNKEKKLEDNRSLSSSNMAECFGICCVFCFRPWLLHYEISLCFHSRVSAVPDHTNQPLTCNIHLPLTIPNLAPTNRCLIGELWCRYLFIIVWKQK